MTTRIDTQTRINVSKFRQCAREADDVVTAPILVLADEDRTPTVPIRRRFAWLTDEDRTPTIPFLLFPRRG